MDERRAVNPQYTQPVAVPVENRPHYVQAPPETPAPPPPAPTTPRRSTPFWKQLIGAVILLGIGFLAWAYFYPNAANVLDQYGISLPFIEPAPEAVGATPMGRPGGPGRVIPLVTTAPVAGATINNQLTAIGEGSAQSSVTIATTASGTLQSLAVRPGQSVEAGDVIGQLDAASEQIALDRAQLAAQDAAAALARATELRNSNSVAQVQLQAAQLTNDQAQLELRNAQLALERRVITTPIAGTVGLLQVTPGNAVSAQTVITTVEDNSDILVNFWVPERFAQSISSGMALSATSSALPGQSFTGEVSAVDNRIDPASRTLQVQARLPNDDGRIRPGMSFSVILQFAGETFASVDPLSVQWSAEGAYVWRYRNGTVEQAFVQIVQRNSSGVLVTGDIAIGDQVVTQGVLQLQPGQSVRLLNAETGEIIEPPAPAPRGGQGGAPQGAPGGAPGR